MSRGSSHGRLRPIEISIATSINTIARTVTTKALAKEERLADGVRMSADVDRTFPKKAAATRSRWFGDETRTGLLGTSAGLESRA